jgi:putative phosphoesterase
MKLALFSDIHGNGFALEAVLKDVLKHKPDVIANLGDSVWGASNPHGAWQLLQQIQTLGVRGNTDELISTKFDTLDEKSHAYASWIREQLPYEAIDTLANLPIIQELADGEVVIAHGALHDTWDALLFDLKQDSTVPRNETELLEQAKRFPRAKVFVVGHTHRELLRVVGGITFINLGPVSRPFDQHSATRWLLLEKQGPHWNPSFKRVEYAVEKAVEWAKNHSPFGEQEEKQLRVKVKE